MALFIKADLKNAATLLKAGRVESARHILSTSPDPYAGALLAKVDVHFPFPPEATTPPVDAFSEVKRLIARQKFDQAERLLQASSHPSARYLLRKIALKKAASGTSESSPSQQGAVKPTLLLDLVSRSSRQKITRHSCSKRA